MKFHSACGCAFVAAALSLTVTACGGGSTMASPTGERPLAKQPLSGQASLRAFLAAHPNKGRAQNVKGQFHIARDGVSRVYENHATFVLPGYQITGRVSGLVLGPHNEVTILADFLHGDTVVRHRTPSSPAISSLEIGS